MGVLPAKDIQPLFASLVELYRLGSYEEWLQYLLPSLRSFIASDRVSYNEIEHGKPASVSMSWDPAEDRNLMQPLIPVFVRHFHEHPLADYVRRGGTAPLRWSDVTTTAEFERTILYNDYYRHIHTRAQLAVALSVNPARTIAIALSRSSRDFTDQEKATLDLLAPHLIQSFHNAQTLTQLKARLGTLEQMVGQLERGVLEISGKETICWATPRAFDWIRTYWPEEVARPDQLPVSLVRWVRAQEAGLSDSRTLPPWQQPLVLERGPQTLIVRLLRDGARRLLVFEERLEGPRLDRLLTAGLGRRESEVLSWVACGKTNDEVGVILSISPKTVKKHLERIFEKLGVETRTAAAAKALELSR